MKYYLLGLMLLTTNSHAAILAKDLPGLMNTKVEKEDAEEKEEEEPITLCPDDTHVRGKVCTRCPDGTYVGHKTCRLGPGDKYY